MSFDLRVVLNETFDVPVPDVPAAAIRQRSARRSARATARWRILVAAVALTSALTVTLALERYVPGRAHVPIVSSTPSPLVT